MKLDVSPIAAAFSFMMTPAFFQFAVFLVIVHTGKDQLILITLTSIISFYAGMGSTASTMMTGKDFFPHGDDSDTPPPPSRMTKKVETTVETLPDPTPTQGASA